MRIVTALSVLALVGICTGAAYADKVNTNEKPWHYNFPHSRAIYAEDENVNNSCPGQVMSCGDEINPAAINPAADLDWVQFYVTNAGDLITCGTDTDGDGTTMDTYIELYDVCGGTMLTYDDDSGPGFYSLISNYPAPHAGWYYLLVHSYAYASTGTYKLDVTCGGGAPIPPDDVCSGAGSLQRCTSGTFTGDLTNYHNDYDPGTGGCSSGYSEAGKDQVVKIDLNAGDVVNMTYNTAGQYDAAFYIITDCSNPAGSCVVGADAAYDVETINWTATATGTYYIILDAYGTDAGGGPYTLTYNFSCPSLQGACCVNYVCTITSQNGCQGQYYGDGTTCTPSPCPAPVPTKTETWGQIKHTYH